MILDLLFPIMCLECKKVGKYICDDCLKKIQLSGWRGNNYSVFRYEGVIRKAIIALKYKFATSVAEELIDKAVEVLKQKSVFKNIKTPVLVPIPLHRRRYNWRGFNQTEVLGEKLAEEMEWKFVPNLLIRTKFTKPQVELKGYERHKNLTGVFDFNNSFKKYSKRNIILFDDVCTTGSTINVAKELLRNEGFKNLVSLTISR